MAIRNLVQSWRTRDELISELHGSYRLPDIKQGFKDRDESVCERLADIGRAHQPGAPEDMPEHIHVWTGYELALGIERGR